jgi:hypothetical protein
MAFGGVLGAVSAGGAAAGGADSDANAVVAAGAMKRSGSHGPVT